MSLLSVCQELDGGVGTAASVHQMTAWTHPVPRYSLVLGGLCRFRVEEVRRELPFPVARITQLDYTHEEGMYGYMLEGL